MRAIRVIGKILKVLLIIVLALFAGTFTIYMFNLENKLIYNVIYPFLQKHYNSQQLNRKI